MKANLKIQLFLMKIFNHPLISGIGRAASWPFSTAIYNHQGNRNPVQGIFVSSLPRAFLTTNNTPSVSNNSKLLLPKATASTIVNKPRGFSKEWYENSGPTSATPPNNEGLRRTPSVDSMESHAVKQQPGAGQLQVGFMTR